MIQNFMNSGTTLRHDHHVLSILSYCTQLCNRLQGKKSSSQTNVMNVNGQASDHGDVKK